jgi:hypothetical protein
VTARARVLVVVAVAAALGLGAAPAALARTERLVRVQAGFRLPEGRLTLTIKANGRAALKHGNGTFFFRLPGSELHQLKRELRDARFAGLRHRYAHKVRPISGSYPNRITYRGRTVVVTPGAATPPRLSRVVNALQAIYLKYM